MSAAVQPTVVYVTDGTLPADSVPAGTNILGTMPPLFGADRLADRFLAAGLDRGEACVLLTTDTGAKNAARQISAYTTTDDALTRLGIVDATGQQPGPDATPYHVETVGSPADLTGLGIAFQNVSERVLAEAGDPVRVVFDSLSSLIVYNEFEPVYRFTNTLTGYVERLDGIGLFLTKSDVEDQHISTLASVFDGRLEFRETDSGTAYRLLGMGDDHDWHDYDHVRDTVSERPEESATTPSLTDSSWNLSDDGAAGAAGGDAGGPRLPADEPIGSLHELIERMSTTGYTLTVCNYTGDDDDLETLRAYFGRLNVTLTTATLSTDLPTDVAVLHREAEPLAMSSVQSLQGAVRMDALDDVDARQLDVTRPDVLDEVYRQQYTVDNGGKMKMVRVSRMIETRALDTGTGTLHTGFQRLQRIDDELGTRELYERIVESGVDVHVYGLPSEVPREEIYTVHAEVTDELAESWFVVFAGESVGDQAGALVSEEVDPARYSGFWTFRPAVATAADEYLRRTYPSGT